MRNQTLSNKSLELSLIFFTIIFINPFKNRKIVRIIHKTLYMISTLIVLVLTTVLWFVNEHDVFFIAEFIWNFGLISLVTVKYIPLIIWEDKLINLIENRKHFWSVDGYSESFDAELNGIYKIAYTCIKCFSGFAAMTEVMSLLMPLFTADGLLTISYCTPSTYIYVLLIQYFMSWNMASITTSTTNLFIITVADLIVQFRIIKRTILETKWSDDKASKARFEQIIEYYKFIMGYIEDFKNVLLTPIIGLYFSTIVTTCVESYVALETSADLLYKGRCVTFILTILFQLSVYCVPISEFIAEIRHLSEVWYKCEWINSPKYFRKSLPLLIMRTQNVPDFKALGLMTINNMAIIDALKATMSFLTFMRNLK